LVTVDPEVIFLVFLPAFLYEAAWYTSWNDFWKWISPISLLAFGLVIITSLAVAYLQMRLADLVLKEPHINEKVLQRIVYLYWCWQANLMSKENRLVDLNELILISNLYLYLKSSFSEIAELEA
jgi:hypothetical protein